ncbi:MAG: ATP-binding cassette domain-containing protein [Candidatus Freyarchaeota archaeon]|nr:ATP-binding cassette domain-containing protein [Candidatus Jordarchaeia archaeon]
MSIIEVRDLKKVYNGNVVALKGISFDVERGEIFGFLGPNGAGKTTTVHILCTLITPTSGSATVCGFDVVKEPDEVRKRIGFVPQDISVDDDLTARENLELHAKLYHMPKDLRKRRIEEVLELVGLQERADNLVKTFSGGMRRRLEIAEGLLHNPEILFLDEPTIGLDPASRIVIWDQLKEMNKEGVTIFITTHYMDEADRLCDQVAIIDLGEIRAMGKPGELKEEVGGDVLFLVTNDSNKLLEKLLSLPFIKDAVSQDGTLRVTVKSGEKVIPLIFEEARNLGVNIEAVSLSKPTLDDVFVKYTGRSLRDEKIDKVERFKQYMLMKRRRR